MARGPQRRRADPRRSAAVHIIQIARRLARRVQLRSGGVMQAIVRTSIATGTGLVASRLASNRTVLGLRC